MSHAHFNDSAKLDPALAGKLANTGFIFGGNHRRARIAMTAPVTQRAAGERIAMTTPVSQRGAGDRRLVSIHGEDRLREAAAQRLHHRQ